MEMSAPNTEKEVRGFLGRLNYIARFISQLTSTCDPIFRLLRKNQVVEWNEDCQAAFDRIKQYLQDPPVLRSPVSGRPLILYLTMLDESMGYVLGQHDETGKKEYAIYYLSKRFLGCEQRYSRLERTCCALTWATHRLRQYMLSHTTWLISKMDPMRLFDGASNALGHGIGVVLISPENHYISMTTRLYFSCTNNVAQYEACAMGILAVIESKVKVLEVYGDSALMVHQLKEEWETRDQKLIPYQSYIRG